MSEAFILPTAPAPPAPVSAPPQAASPARDAPNANSGSSFKQALAAAQKPGADKSADTSAAAQSTPQPSDSQPADPNSDANDPIKQALLAALAALTLSLVQPQAATVTTPTDNSQPVITPGATAQSAEAASAQATLTQTGTQAEATAQFADQVKAQAETQAVVPQAPALPLEPLPAQAQVKKTDDNLAALAQVLADRLKVVVDKPPSAPPQAPQDLAALSLAAGLAKVASPTLSELARSSEAPAANALPFVAQIQQGIETLAKSGQTSVHLQLYPEALGRVDMRLSSGADGVHVSLTANLAATSSLLERHAEDLRRALTDSGLTVAGLSIGFSLGQGKSSNTSEWQSSTSGWAPASSLASTAVPTLDEAALSASVDAGRVDYRI
jgi:flagellar hook-length control protein FliK